jgi:membrane protease YdiL (CAAX protease family)
MLPERFWRAEAILRLFARVVVCVFMGAVANSMVDFLNEPRHIHPAVILTSIAGALALFIASLLVLGRSWRLETFARNSLLLLLCFYGGLALMWLSFHWHGQLVETRNSTAGMLIAVFSFQGAALVFVHSFLREHGVGWAEAFGLKTDLRRALALGVILGCFFLPIGWALQSASAAMLEHLHLPPHEQQAVQVLRSTQSAASRLALGFAAILLAPAAEEILFRGILYPAIKQRGHPRLAWWGTALLFGVIHFNLVSAVPLTVLALCLIWIYEKTGNLVAPIAAHTVFNALNFAALFLGQAVIRLP